MRAALFPRTCESAGGGAVPSRAPVRAPRGFPSILRRPRGSSGSSGAPASAPGGSSAASRAPASAPGPSGAFPRSPERPGCSGAARPARRVPLRPRPREGPSPSPRGADGGGPALGTHLGLGGPAAPPSAPRLRAAGAGAATASAGRACTRARSLRAGARARAAPARAGDGAAAPRGALLRPPPAARLTLSATVAVPADAGAPGVESGATCVPTTAHAEGRRRRGGPRLHLLNIA